MKVITWFVLAALIFSGIFFSGCSDRIEGWEAIRELTAEERADLLAVAFTSEYLQKATDTSRILKVEHGWAVLNWEQNLERPSFHQFPYLIEDSFRPYFEKTLENGNGVLPVVIVTRGNLQLSLIIDPDSRTIVAEAPGILTPVPDRPETESSDQQPLTEIPPSAGP